MSAEAITTEPKRVSDVIEGLDVPAADFIYNATCFLAELDDVEKAVERARTRLDDIVKQTSRLRGILDIDGLRVDDEQITKEGKEELDGAIDKLEFEADFIKVLARESNRHLRELVPPLEHHKYYWLVNDGAESNTPTEGEHCWLDDVPGAIPI